MVTVFLWIFTRRQKNWINNDVTAWALFQNDIKETKFEIQYKPMGMDNGRQSTISKTIIEGSVGEVP